MLWIFPQYSNSSKRRDTTKFTIAFKQTCYSFSSIRQIFAVLPQEKAEFPLSTYTNKLTTSMQQWICCSALSACAKAQQYVFRFAGYYTSHIPPLSTVIRLLMISTLHILFQLIRKFGKLNGSWIFIVCFYLSHNNVFPLTIILFSLIDIVLFFVLIRFVLIFYLRLFRLSTYKYCDFVFIWMQIEFTPSPTNCRMRFYFWC